MFREHGYRTTTETGSNSLPIPFARHVHIAVSRGRDRLGLAKIAEHIYTNLSRRIKVDELARIAGLNALQFSRAFRREHAITPYAYVLEIRIAHAKDLLGAGAPIAEAAADAGFADQSHLTRHFRRLVGMTPRKYVDAFA